MSMFVSIGAGSPWRLQVATLKSLRRRLWRWGSTQTMPTPFWMSNKLTARGKTKSKIYIPLMYSAKLWGDLGGLVNLGIWQQQFGEICNKSTLVKGKLSPLQ